LLFGSSIIETRGNLQTRYKLAALAPSQQQPYLSICCLRPTRPNFPICSTGGERV